MLTLTADAVAAIRVLTSRPETPPETGLRISASVVNGSGRSLELSIAGGPHPDDLIVEAEGVRVFLEPIAASYLDDKILDADLATEAKPAFRIITQP